MAQQLPPPQMNVGLGGPQWANPTGAPMQQPTQNINSTIGASAVSQHESEFFAPVSTLDEPVRETIMRDVRSVGGKLKVVLLPMERSVCSFKIEKGKRARTQRMNLALLCFTCGLVCHYLMYFLLLILYGLNYYFQIFLSFPFHFRRESLSASVWWLFGSFSVGNNRFDRARQTNH